VMPAMQIVRAQKRQRCGSGTVQVCFRWTIGALFGRPKREKPRGICRVFGSWTAGAGGSFFGPGEIDAAGVADEPGDRARAQSDRIAFAPLCEPQNA
jgi:hypothetical protein